MKPKWERKDWSYMIYGELFVVVVPWGPPRGSRFQSLCLWGSSSFHPPSQGSSTKRQAAQCRTQFCFGKKNSAQEEIQGRKSGVKGWTLQCQLVMSSLQLASKLDRWNRQSTQENRWRVDDGFWIQFQSSGSTRQQMSKHVSRSTVRYHNKDP